MSQIDRLCAKIGLVNKIRCQFGPLLGLPGGSRCFTRVPRALLVIINWSTAPNKHTGEVGVEWSHSELNRYFNH